MEIKNQPKLIIHTTTPKYTMGKKCIAVSLNGSKKNFVKIYSEQIDSGDISFFIENDYRKQHGYKEDEQVWALDKIELLRQPVKNMNDDEKTKVVKYLQNLKKLTDLYNQLKSK